MGYTKWDIFKRWVKNVFLNLLTYILIFGGAYLIVWSIGESFDYFFASYVNQGWFQFGAIFLMLFYMLFLIGSVYLFFYFRKRKKKYHGIPYIEVIRYAKYLRRLYKAIRKIMHSSFNDKCYYYKNGFECIITTKEEPYRPHLILILGYILANGATPDQACKLYKEFVHYKTAESAIWVIKFVIDNPTVSFSQMHYKKLNDKESDYSKAVGLILFNPEIKDMIHNFLIKSIETKQYPKIIYKVVSKPRKLELKKMFLSEFKYL